MDNSLIKRARDIPDEARGRGKIFGMIGGQANPLANRTIFRGPHVFQRNDTPRPVNARHAVIL